MRIDAGVASIQGKRSRNEDAAAVVVAPGGALLVVADGMGGHADGDKASATALESLIPAMQAHPRGSWVSVFADLDSRVRMVCGDGYRAPGTTLSVASIRATGAMTVAYAGDSPVLHIRGTEAIYVAEPHGYGNRVTRCLGGGLDGVAKPDVHVTDVLAGDVVLVASDGLDVLLDDLAVRAKLIRRLHKSLATVERSEGWLDRLCERIATEAVRAGSTDNVSVALAVVS